MARILIVGSGASGVHFALSVLKKGHEVLMLDVGNKKRDPVNPANSFSDLKVNLKDPVRYFLGDNFEGVLYPGSKGEYYGFPPSKNYVFEKSQAGNFDGKGFAPLVSFAQGGLAEAWTGGVYPFNDHELTDFPFSYLNIKPFYEEVAHRIGISGVADDLSRLIPIHDNLLEPLDLDTHSKVLLGEYQKRKEFMNSRLKFYLGRSRVASLSKNHDGRPSCSYLGRCLWGCPSEAFYTPSITLRECSKFPNFQYHRDTHVKHFKFNAKRQITKVFARSLRNQDSLEFPVDKLVLAAGTLNSSRIFLESIFHNTREIVKLPGFMDNRQILIPFLNLKMVGKTIDAHAYQYHQIAFGLENEAPKENLHGLITTLKTALYHPIIQKIPVDLKNSIGIFRDIHAGLGLVNLNFPDHRQAHNYVTLNVPRGSQNPRLSINYSDSANDREVVRRAIKRVKRGLWQLKCIVPPGMIHVRPMGASVHYAGTIPMSTSTKPYTTSEYCQSHDFDNLYIVDGTTFPFLPAKNITFTLMANAVRVAENAF